MGKRKSKIGCLFWVALVLLVAVIFLFNRERIKTVIESTGFLSFLAERREEKEKEGPEVNVESESESTESGAEDDTGKETTVIEIEDTDLPEGADESGEVREGSEGYEEAEEENTEANGEQNLRNAKLYFIDVGDDGVISLQAVVRQINFIDSPLTETLRSLLSGMLPSELNMELISLIPENTALLSVSVTEGTAFINFSEDFRFNSLGKEGYMAQLKQIVYTATEFSTVQDVQILIEGKQYDYLGPEGVFIGQPLTRNSFN